MKKSATTSNLKVLDVSPLVNTSDATRQTKIYDLNGERFRIFYENTNGSPLGFKSNMALSQYCRVHACWNYLEDITVLDIPRKPTYHDLPESKAHCALFFKKMEERLVKIYA